MGKRPKKSKKWLTRKQIQNVRCPRCWARPGRWCSDERGPRPTNHAERVDYALVIHGRKPLPPQTANSRP